MKWLRWKDLSKSKKIRALYTLVCVLIAGFMQASIIQIFMRPMNLLSSGFTGLAILIEKITSDTDSLLFDVELNPSDTDEKYEMIEALENAKLDLDQLTADLEKVLE